MATFLGLDIGAKTITGAVFSGSANRFRLVDFFVKEVTTVDQAVEQSAGGSEIVTPTSIPEMVAAAIAERGLGKADVVAAVDAKDAIIREIVVPFTKDEHIRKTIFSEAEEHFQTFDIGDVQLEYFKVEEVGDKSRTVIAAVRNDAIRQRLDLLQGASVDPIALDLDATALFNAFALTPTFDATRSILLVDMGASSTKVLLVEKGVLKKVRAVRLSATSAARLIAQPVGAAAAVGAALPFPDTYSIEARFAEIENALRRLEPTSGDEGGGLPDGEEPIAILTDEEFEIVQRDPVIAPPSAAAPRADAPSTATPPKAGAAGRAQNGSATNGAAGEAPGAAANGAAPNGSASPEVYGDYLRRLGIEIQRTFASSFLRGGIDLICLTGGMSDREEARRFFADEFDVETIPLDFGDSFPMDVPPETQPEVGRVGAVAVGLGLKLLGKDRVGFDFRKNQFRFERKFERVKYPVLAASILLFLFFLQSFYILLNQKVTINEHIAQIQAKEQEAFKAFFDKETDSDRPFNRAQDEKKKFQTAIGMQGGANIPSFVPLTDALGEISRAVKEASTSALSIQSIDLKLKTKTVGGKLLAEGDSTMQINCSDPTVNSKLANVFGKGERAVFEYSGSISNQGGTTKISVTLKLLESYINKFLKK